MASAPTSVDQQLRLHKQAHHLLIRQDANFFSYVLLPNQPEQLCFTDHHPSTAATAPPKAPAKVKNCVAPPPPLMELCCVREEDHIHAHVHHGEMIQDILLQECMDGAGCTLPLLWDFSTSCARAIMSDDMTMLPIKGAGHEYHGCHAHDLAAADTPDDDHVHVEGCGHEPIRHGDHVDWLVRLSDGSFLLTHRGDDDVAPRAHGFLVKIGESRGRSRKSSARRFFDLFQYQLCPGHDQGQVRCTNTAASPLPVADDQSLATGSGQASAIPVVDVDGAGQVSVATALQLQKTVLDVLGICCPAEVPLVKKLLEPIAGVKEVSVNVAMKTVTVHHEAMINKASLVKVLNSAELEASVHVTGEWKEGHKWPSPYVLLCGLLLAVSFLSYAYRPLKWVAIGAVVVGVPPMLRKAVISLRRYILDVNVLMLIAVSGAIGLGDYLEAGSIVFLFTIAEWLESRSSAKARLAISSVAQLAPQEAVLAETEEKVSVAEVKVGTRISVKAGEAIPIDGVVVSGASAVDESSLTGESFPVEKEVGGQVWAGTINLTGYVCVETTSLSDDTAVARMVRLVEEAQNQRTEFEMLVEKCAKVYTPTVIVAAIAVCVVPAIMHVNHVRHWVYTALVLLVMACPCALVISTPIAVTCAIAQAARTGLIVKGGKYLEALGGVRVLAVDKTGTLTEGLFQVLDDFHLLNNANVDSHGRPSVNRDQLLHWVSSIESKASHPMAAAIVEHARLHGAEPNGEVANFEIVVGEGVKGEVDGHEICIGNERLVTRLKWADAEIGDASVLERWRSQGFTICWVSVDGVPHAVFSVGDQLRREAVEAVGTLSRLGLRIAMVTGDSQASANIVQSKLGEMDVYARCLPEDKVEVVRQLKRLGRTGMVGDGINDAPALATADVGIAMGVAGTAIAIETADIALMTNDLRRLASAVKLARRSQTKIKQNIVLSVATKVMAIVLAAFGYAHLWVAVVTDVGTCLAVIFNSMMLLEAKKSPSSTKSYLGLKIGHGRHGHGHGHSHGHGHGQCGSKKCSGDHERDLEAGENDCEAVAGGKSCSSSCCGEGGGATVRRRILCCTADTCTTIIPNDDHARNCCRVEPSTCCRTSSNTNTAATRSTKGGCCNTTDKKQHHHNHAHASTEPCEVGHGQESTPMTAMQDSICKANRTCTEGSNVRLSSAALASGGGGGGAECGSKNCGDCQTTHRGSIPGTAAPGD